MTYLNIILTLIFIAMIFNLISNLAYAVKLERNEREEKAEFKRRAVANSRIFEAILKELRRMNKC